jgi:hypothetical protein
MVNTKWPTGDQGGNKFFVKKKDGTTIEKLHFVWDSVLYEYQDFIGKKTGKLPFKDSYWKELGDTVESI